MRVGIDARFVGRQSTGNESYIINLARGLAKVDLGANTYTLYFPDERSAACPIVEDRRFQNRALRSRSSLLFLGIALPREIARRPVDVVHAMYYLPPLLPERTRTVVTIHDISWESEGAEKSRLVGPWRRLVAWSARRADRVVTISHSEKHELIERYRLEPDKIVVTPLAADSMFVPRDRDDARRRLATRFGIRGTFMLYVGNLLARKNIARVLRAFVWLRRHRRYDVKMVMVGPLSWGSATLRRSLRELQDTDDVICTGYVDQDDLPDLYSAAEAFVFPSLYEGFGIPVLEAMGCGTPVITSNRTACPEVAGDAAVLVDPENWEAIAEAMERVLGSAELRECLRAAGLERAKHFSWDTTAAATLAAYQ